MSSKIRLLLILISFMFLKDLTAQTLSETQMRNARASAYAVIAARNPGVSFSVLMIPWDGTNTLEYNAQTYINTGWHAQAVVKGNYFTQAFDGVDFSSYSTVLLSQAEFDTYQSLGTQWWIACSTLPPFSKSDDLIVSGKIGIGTTSPSEKLSVNGNVIAKKFIVTQIGWSDYVFRKDYKLRSRTNLESFIRQNKHLPDIPSAKEVKEKGISVGDNQALLLKKNEELTLYVIGQQKEIEELKKSLKRTVK